MMGGFLLLLRLPLHLLLLGETVIIPYQFLRFSLMSYLSISCNLDNQSVANQDLSPIRSPRRPPLSLSPGLGLDDHGNQTNRHGSPIRRQISRSHQSSPESHHSRRSVSFILLRYLAIATVVLLSYRQGVSSHTWTIGDSSSAKF